MKRTLSVFSALMMISTLMGQTPLKVSYQAIIRDAGELLIVNQPVGIRISVMDGAVAVYTETHSATTNENALVGLELGAGTPLTGTFAGIDWSDGPYSLKSEIDLTGGTTYTITRTDQILSLPYAFNAKVTGSFSTADYNDLSNLPVRDGSETRVSAGTNITISGSGTLATPYVVGVSGGGASYSHLIGELYQGGIIVAVWKEAGVEKGLIASVTDVGTSTWSNITGTLIGATAQSFRDGKTNSDAILAQPGHIGGAAMLCDIYTNPDNGTGIYSDWYLPAAWELNMCYDAAIAINTILGDANGFLFNSYWSSTEYSSTRAYIFSFSNGNASFSLKSNSFQVRAVRRF